MTYSIDLRERAVDGYEDKQGTRASVADLFKVSTSSLGRWVRKWRMGGTVAPEPHGGGQKPKVDEVGEKVVEQLVGEDPAATLAELATSFEERTKIKVSTSPIRRVIAKLGLVRKKLAIRATEQRTERVEHLRRVFTQLMAELRAEDLVFVDETGTRVGMRRLHGRGLRGERIVAEAPARRGQNVSAVGAITLWGVQAAMTLDGAIDGEAYLVFVREILVPTIRPGQVVVMDNLSTHKVPGVVEAIEQAGGTVRWLPPYSPDLSPIEEGWSKVKSSVRRAAAQTRQALHEAIAKALQSITPTDCAGWFRHSGLAVA